jgi:hypothetical protein
LGGYIKNLAGKQACNSMYLYEQTVGAQHEFMFISKLILQEGT